MLRRFGPLLVAVLALPTIGCSSRIGYFNVLSTKNVGVRNIDTTKLPRQENVVAQDIGFLGIGVTLQDAVDKALAKGGGNLMIDAVVYYKEYPLFEGVQVRGTVINVPGTPSSVSPYAMPAPTQSSAPAQPSAPARVLSPAR